MSFRYQVRTCCLSLATVLMLTVATQAADFKANSYSELGSSLRRVTASHFLMRTTFGPTMDEIDALAERIRALGVESAFNEWIDKQFDDYPISSNSEAYETDRGRLWPLAKQMVRDSGYLEANYNENTQNNNENDGVYNRNQFKEHAWFHRALTSKDQLRQRMAWALSQIFVVAEGPAVFQNMSFDTSANPRWLSLAKYYDDVCIDHAFGNYRELLDTMTYHPMMGVWLTTVQNAKANTTTGSEPDENYAREIMQLFSIGLVELKANGNNRIGPDGQFVDTYDNETITALARVFTGLAYNNGSSNDSFGAGVNLHEPMEMYQQEHDVDQKVAFKGRLIVPARSSTDANAREDIADVHDFLAFEHRNTAPFLCRQLIQRFVMSNPPRGYVRRVSKVFSENKNDPKQFQKVIKAILLDPVAMRPLRLKKLPGTLGFEVLRKFPTERTRLREPILRYTAMIRAFSPYPDPSFLTDGNKTPFYLPGGAEGVAGRQYFLIDNDSAGVGANFAQAPFESESVFNFYLPDFQPAGEISDYVPSKYVLNGKLRSPEFQILSPVTANETQNEFRDSVIDSDIDIGNQWYASGTGWAVTGLDVNLDFTPYFGSGGVLGTANIEPTTAQVEEFLETLDLLLCGGTMSRSTKETLLAVCQAELNSYNVDTLNEKEDLVQAVISVVLQSPDCAIIP